MLESPLPNPPQPPGPLDGVHSIVMTIGPEALFTAGPVLGCASPRSMNVGVLPP